MALLLASVVLVAGVVLLIGNEGADAPLVIDKKRCEIRCSGVIQKTSAPRMNDFASAVPALLGSKGGTRESFFVFLIDTSVESVHDALVELGARSRLAYRSVDVAKHRGPKPDNTPADYLQGDPVQILVLWKENENMRCLAYEDFFLEQIDMGGTKTQKPWTPHFVFHGSGVLNNAKTGCIACTHDCPGGIIGNNQFPLVDPVPVLRADWTRLPKPGTAVTIAFRPVPSRREDRDEIFGEECESCSYQPVPDTASER